jgi:hypothetical protein
MRAIVMAALAAVALAACGQSTETKQEEPPVIEAPNYDADIGPSGAAGISTAVRFNVTNVQTAAPGYIVAEAQDQVEGNPFTAITLSAGDEEVFRLYPTHDNLYVHAISTRSTQARGPNAEIVGVATFSQLAAADTAVCLEESNGSGEFACSAAEDANFWRIYESGGMRRADAKLVEMRWIAPRAG